MKSQEEMRDWVTVFYNILDYENTKDCSESCIHGKAKCLDVEQYGLLNKILYRQDIIQLTEINTSWRFENTNTGAVKLCQHGKGSELGLFDCHVKLSPINWDKVAGAASKHGNKFDQFLMECPVVHTLNYQTRIEERNSLLYLCVFGNYPEIYYEILYRALICKAIDYRNDSEKKENLKIIIEKLMKKLTEFWNDREREAKYLQKSYSRYCDGWGLLVDPTVRYSSIMFTIMLKYVEYYKKKWLKIPIDIKACIEKPIKNVKEHMSYLHNFFMWIMNCIEISFEMPKDYIFETDECCQKHDIYNEIIEIYNRANGKNEKDKILGNLKKLLMEKDEIAFEDLESLEI